MCFSSFQSTLAVRYSIHRVLHSDFVIYQNQVIVQVGSGKQLPIYVGEHSWENNELQWFELLLKYVIRLLITIGT